MRGLGMRDRRFHPLGAVMAAPRQKSSAPSSKKETEVFVVFVCKWGINRSVGMAEIARHIFKSNGFDTTMAKHLSTKYWSKWKCGVNRCWCEAMTHKKTEALEAVQGVFAEVFL